jgi:F-type H+-transporting ATPase subunit epsilon
MTLTFDLVTPEQLVFSQDVSMVVIPGTDGDFGVLDAHAPLISTIRPGVVDLYENESISNKVFVTGGFAEVGDGRCTLLATEAFDLATTSKTDAEKLLFDIKEKLAVSLTDKEKEFLESEIKVIEQLVDLCN